MCQFLVQKVKDQVTREGRNTQESAAVLELMFHYGWLKHRPLLDLIYCQRRGCSATGRTAAYHVSTRHQHLCFFNSRLRLVRLVHGVVIELNCSITTNNAWRLAADSSVRSVLMPADTSYTTPFKRLSIST